MTPDTLSLAGKVAIITGSGRENGIGASIANALARNGASVTINYVSSSSAPRAAAVVKKIQGAGGKAIVVQASVDVPEDGRRLVLETLKAFGADHIDILVNNAGRADLGPTLETSKETIQAIFNINVLGTILLTQAVVPHMIPGGRIINIGSVTSKMGMSLGSVYCASKAAVDSLTFSWAQEFGKTKGITVNVLAPGPVLTEINNENNAQYMDNLKGEIEKTLEKTRAANRLGTVEDISDAVLLIVNEKSRWITGQHISVSGGITGQ